MFDSENSRKRIRDEHEVRVGTMCFSMSRSREMGMEMVMNGEKRWSDLPVLLLWMILDRLNYVERERPGFVCKAWKRARQSYRPPPTPPPPSGSISPWVIHRPASNPYYNCYIIFNPFTMESFTLGPFYKASSVVFSKKGWLLFQGRSEDMFTVNLYHLPTGATITMPSPHVISVENKPASPYRIPGDVASFSTYDDGTPKTVAFAFGADKSFYICDVRTKIWNKRTIGVSTCTRKLLVVGNKLYALDPEGILIIYDILTSEWTQVAADHMHVPVFQSVRGLAESENGEILKIEPSYRCSPLFHISKLNTTQTGWEQILPHHQPSIFNSWYLSLCGNHFVTTNQEQQQQEAAGGGGGGIKVYDLKIPPGKDTNATIIFHDFKNSIQRPLMDSPPPPLRPQWNQIKWIDLGSMEKVPPACLRYHPGTQHHPQS